jgi:hypothetical protein
MAEDAKLTLIYTVVVMNKRGGGIVKLYVYNSYKTCSPAYSSSQRYLLATSLKEPNYPTELSTPYRLNF